MVYGKDLLVKLIKITSFSQLVIEQQQRLTIYPSCQINQSAHKPHKIIVILQPLVLIQVVDR